MMKKAFNVVFWFIIGVAVIIGAYMVYRHAVMVAYTNESTMIEEVAEITGGETGYLRTEFNWWGIRMNREIDYKQFYIKNKHIEYTLDTNWLGISTVRSYEET